MAKSVNSTKASATKAKATKPVARKAIAAVALPVNPWVHLTLNQRTHRRTLSKASAHLPHAAAALELRFMPITCVKLQRFRIVKGVLEYSAHRSSSDTPAKWVKATAPQERAYRRLCDSYLSKLYESAAKSLKYATADSNNLEEDFKKERARLDGRIAKLGGVLDLLDQRVRDGASLTETDTSGLEPIKVEGSGSLWYLNRNRNAALKPMLKVIAKRIPTATMSALCPDSATLPALIKLEATELLGDLVKAGFTAVQRGSGRINIESKRWPTVGLTLTRRDKTNTWTTFWYDDRSDK